MEYVKKTFSSFIKLERLTYCLSFLFLVLYLYIRQDVYLFVAIGLFCLLGLLIVINRRIKKEQVSTLIKHTDCIIERKPFEVIDGEGEISLLSHKLYLLSKRYFSVIESIEKEQMKLKDYIENISHQLKTPLTSMRLNEELLIEIVKDKAQKDMVESIYLQTLKMEQLVNELLVLALIDSNSVTFHFEKITVKEILQLVEEDLKFMLEEKDVQLNIMNDSFILCDPKWIQEAFKNIIKNSIEKCPHSVIDISVQEFDSLVTVIIHDHGEGFSEADFTHVFERFYRGTKNDYNGVGIGMALSKEIIEKHHGLIKISNNKGAVIEITIPKVLGKTKV